MGYVGPHSGKSVQGGQKGIFAFHHLFLKSFEMGYFEPSSGRNMKINEKGFYQPYFILENVEPYVRDEKEALIIHNYLGKSYEVGYFEPPSWWQYVKKRTHQLYKNYTY